MHEWLNGKGGGSILAGLPGYCLVFGGIFIYAFILENGLYLFINSSFNTIPAYFLYSYDYSLFFTPLKIMYLIFTAVPVKS
jgi:hypothetical protein